MTRRHFMSKVYRWGAAGTLLGLLPAWLWARCARPSGVKNKVRFNTAGLDLWEIVQQKLHHGQSRYINPFNPGQEHSLWRVLRWKLLAENQFKPLYDEERVVPLHLDWKRVRSHDGLAVTYLPHAGLMLKDNGTYVLIDPVLYGLAGWTKNFTPIASGLEQMPPPDHVLITHGHYDHLDKQTLAHLDKNAHVITPNGYNGVFKTLGLANRTQLDWLDRFGDRNWEFTLLPCNHWTLRNFFTGPNRSLWGSYLIRTPSGYSIYVSGDTAYFDGIEAIGRRYAIDLAVFNLGAYEPRWFMKQSHMNPVETIQAFQALAARKMMILHWGTFRLGDEPVYYPPLQLEAALAERGLLECWIRLDHGQTYFVSRNGAL